MLLEFLKREQIVEVMHITATGECITLYQPVGAKSFQAITELQEFVGGALLGSLKESQARRESPLSGHVACTVWSVHTLPKRLLPKYIYASRFVRVLRSKTAKVTYFFERSKCILMESYPAPDSLEAHFDGVRISYSPTSHDIRICTRGGAKTALKLNLLCASHGDLQQVLDALNSEFTPHLMNARCGFLVCTRVERNLAALENELVDIAAEQGRCSIFPVVIGRYLNCPKFSC